MMFASKVYCFNILSVLVSISALWTVKERLFFSTLHHRSEESSSHTQKKAAHTVCYSPFRGHSLKDADYYIHKRPHIACCVNQAIDLRSVFVCMVLISSFYFILIFSVLLLTCSCPTVDYFLAIYSRTTIPCNFNMFNVLCFFFVRSFRFRYSWLLFHSHHSFLHHLSPWLYMIRSRALIVFIWIELINYSN